MALDTDRILDAAVAAGVAGSMFRLGGGAFGATGVTDRDRLAAMAERAGYELVEDTGNRMVFERSRQPDDFGVGL